MRAPAKTTSKGQISLPLAIRRQMAVGVADTPVFEARGDRVRVRALRDDNPLAAFAGIGDPEIPSGEDAIQASLREVRGPA